MAQRGRGRPKASAGRQGPSESLSPQAVPVIGYAVSTPLLRSPRQDRVTRMSFCADARVGLPRSKQDACHR